MKVKLIFISLVVSNLTLSAPVGEAPSTFMTSLRGAVGFAIGYGDPTFYAQNNCPNQDPPPASGEDCDDAPPYGGLVGVALDIVNQLGTMLHNAGNSSCAAIPNSGSATAASNDGTSVSFTYATPVHSIPSGWENGGSSFTKRIEMDFDVSTLETKVFAEFSCGVDAAFVGVNMLVGNHAPGYERRINIIVGKLGTEKIAEVYIAEYHPVNLTTRGAYAFRLQINESAQTYQLWSVVSDFPGSVNAMMRTLVHGNYSTNQASVFLEKFNVSTSQDFFNPSTISAMSGSTVSAVESSSNYNFEQTWTSGSHVVAGNIFDKQGCVDFDTPTAVLSSASLCSGLSLSDPAAPALSSSGAFNVLWPIQTMPGLIDVAGIEVQ